MNAKEENPGQPHKTDQSSTTDESAMVARAAGSAIGGIVSAAKAASSSNYADHQPGEGKLKPNRQDSSESSEQHSGDKRSEARAENKKRKKMAHRRVLKRAHANG